MHLMAASKKGMSAHQLHQLHRMLGVAYKSAWVAVRGPSSHRE